MISAILFGNPGSSSYQALEHIITNRQLILCDQILHEIDDFIVASRPKQARKFRVELLSSLKKYSKPTGLTTPVVLRDVNDIPIVQIAVEYQAIIVTNDNDLLCASLQNSTAITAAEYVALFT